LRQPAPADRYTPFTCFAGTKVQTLTKLRSASPPPPILWFSEFRGAMSRLSSATACFTRTKVLALRVQLCSTGSSQLSAYSQHTPANRKASACACKAARRSFSFMPPHPCSNASRRSCVSICTFAPVVKQVNCAPAATRVPPRSCVSFCTFCISKASKLRTCGNASQWLLLLQLSPQLLRQFPSLCTSKASKLKLCIGSSSSNCRRRSCASICTFVPVKQVNYCVHSSSNCRCRSCVSTCTSVCILYQ
jgi:hypothetical protein